MDYDKIKATDPDDDCIQIKQARFLSNKMQIMRQDLREDIRTSDIKYGKLFLKRIGAGFGYKSTKELPLLFPRSDKNKDYAK